MIRDLNSVEIENVAGAGLFGNIFGAVGTGILSPIAGGYNAVASTLNGVTNGLLGGGLLGGAVGGITGGIGGALNGISTGLNGLGYIPQGASGFNNVSQAVSSGIGSFGGLFSLIDL